MITGKPVRGDVAIRNLVEDAVESKNDSCVDEAAGNWPISNALAFAKVALQCTETRGSKRPDLEKEVLPELKKLFDECATSAAASKTIEDENQCVVCWDAPPTHAFLPCGHRCVCESDAAELMARNKLCPVCRSHATGVVRVY